MYLPPCKYKATIYLILASLGDVHETFDRVRGGFDFFFFILFGR
jgi:hypothetical protein